MHPATRTMQKCCDVQLREGAPAGLNVLIRANNFQHFGEKIFVKFVYLSRCIQREQWLYTSGADRAKRWIWLGKAQSSFRDMML
jgi:hypothetical protein